MKDRDIAEREVEMSQSNPMRDFAFTTAVTVASHALILRDKLLGRVRSTPPNDPQSPATSKALYCQRSRSPRRCFRFTGKETCSRRTLDLSWNRGDCGSLVASTKNIGIRRRCLTGFRLLRIRQKHRIYPLEAMRKGRDRGLQGAEATPAQYSNFAAGLLSREWRCGSDS